MSKKQRSLKDILIESSPQPTVSPFEKIEAGEKIEKIKLHLISPNPFQPRKHFDEEKLRELANSIDEHGVFQPIIVKNVKDGYMIVAGERRYRAAKMVGLEVIPAVVRDYNQDQVTELSLIENLQREDLNPIEEAQAYQMMMRSYDLTHEAFAKRISKSRSYVTNALGLLNLVDEVKELLVAGYISMGHARVLSKMEDPKRVKELAVKVINDGLTVRQLERLALEEKKTNIQTRKEKPSHYLTYERELKEYLGYPVKITEKRLTITYKDDDELNILLNKLVKWSMKLAKSSLQKSPMSVNRALGKSLEQV